MVVFAAAVVSIADILQCTCSGVLSGLGLPTRAMVMNFVGYYVLACPLAYLMAFHLDMGLKGRRLRGVAVEGRGRT
jgi:Na+-driven multidrug efflux pump